LDEVDDVLHSVDLVVLGEWPVAMRIAKVRALSSAHHLLERSEHPAPMGHGAS
jgi:hypothetical protein